MLNGIIISGPLRSGKTTTANALIEALNYGNKLSFAEALKREVAKACATSMSEELRYYAEMQNPDTKEFWRTTLQWWGTELRRNRYGADYWVNKTEDYMVGNPDIFWVSDDCRFPNELKMLRKYAFGFVRLAPNPDTKVQGIANHQSEDIDALGEPDLYLEWKPVQNRVLEIIKHYDFLKPKFLIQHVSSV